MPKLKTKSATHKDLQSSLLNIKDALLEATGDAKGRGVEMLTELLENIQNKSNDYQHNLEEHIVEKPLQSVGIALVLGFLAAKFVL